MVIGRKYSTNRAMPRKQAKNTRRLFEKIAREEHCGVDQLKLSPLAIEVNSWMRRPDVGFDDDWAMLFAFARIDSDRAIRFFLDLPLTESFTAEEWGSIKQELYHTGDFKNEPRFKR